MFDAKKLLGGLLRGKMGGGKSFGMGAKAGVGLGVLGVAMEAVSHYMKQSGEETAGGKTAPPAPPPPGGPPPRSEASAPAGTPPPPPPPPGAPAKDPESEEAVLLIRAMIASAAADGEIDPEERDRILGKLEAAELDPEERRFIENELEQPADMTAIVQGVSSPDAARHVYAVSLMAIDLDTEAERDYLKRLAAGLQLDAAEVDRMHEKLDAPKL